MVPERRGRALVLLLIGLLGLGGAALLGPLGLPARAATCDQGGSLIAADWTITTPQVCTGIFYHVDGSVTIDAGGSLTLVNGGLNFTMDAAHRYALTVNAGGALVLDHSTITTDPYQIDPFLKLPLTVSGAGSSFTMTRGSLLQFPGWFNATGATIGVSDSTITGFPDAQLLGTGLWVDDNNDSAVLSWASTTATLYHSRIDHLYENWTAEIALANLKPVTGLIEGNMSLTAGTTLTAYDTFLGADFSNRTGLHNELQVDGTSTAYLYNVTLDTSQNPSVATSWMPALVTAAGGRIDLLRWLHVTVLDATAFPVPGAAIWSTFSPNATTAEYPDNGFSTTPNAATLAYLNRTASGATAWNRTNADGVARIPLFTDEITAASLPNANSFGNFRFTVTYNVTAVSGGVAFPPYPAMNATDNNLGATLSLGGVYIRTPADLALRASDYPAVFNVSQGELLTIHAVVYNLGQTPAFDVSLAAFLDGNRSAPVAWVNGLTVIGSANATLTLPGMASIGNRTILLVVDPNGTVYEGGAAQKANNFLNLTVDVIPPPGGFVAIAAPNAGDSFAPGSVLSVSGYVRDPNFVGIPSVPLTVDLRSGSTVVATTTATSGTNGFFQATLTVPANLTEGTYSVVVSPMSGTVVSDARTVSVAIPRAFLNTGVPLLGIPWWLFLILLALIAAAALGLTVYIKVYGLGKMVECGECGAYIHADAAVCPRCGVEFEKDLAKCSSCGAWIPVEVKQCPECGIEFATGDLDADDYQAKMRFQYEEIVEKFRTQAQRQLRRALTDEEFQEWWRTQPSFITYADWRREEEEVRRKGSKPCPNCGALNSLSAKVCHACGTLMRGAPPKRPTPSKPRGREPTAPAGRSMISGKGEPEEGPPSNGTPEPPANGNPPDSKGKKDGST